MRGPLPSVHRLLVRRQTPVPLTDIDRSRGWAMSPERQAEVYFAMKKAAGGAMKGILEYNEDDCRATRVLLDGIRQLDVRLG